MFWTYTEGFNDESSLEMAEVKDIDRLFILTESSRLLIESIIYTYTNICHFTMGWGTYTLTDITNNLILWKEGNRV